jgi:wyosine [tRNA(Phe)-imidazoG37] synthetase (radical SAM superfamily)
MVYELQEGILYGPVDSRRLGLSLGINLMPATYKLCSFNCVYCHYGYTDVHTMDARKHIEDMPPLDAVLTEVEKALQSEKEFAYLTFSGNGEPTLYPWFAELVDILVDLRNRNRPHVKIALLSNSTGLASEGVRESIPKIDVPVFKLDAGTESKWMAINRPVKGIRFSEIIESLISLEEILLQTVLFGGDPSNVTEDELTAYFEAVRRIRPREVQLYSIDRPVPRARIELVSPEALRAIAQRGEEETGIKMRAFHPR